MKLIALCGMPGAGKTTFKELAHRLYGLPSWYIGQPLVDACIASGLEPTYANRMEIGSKLGLFDPSNPLKFIRFSLHEMEVRHPDASVVVFDSVRSVDELQVLCSFEAQTSLVAVILGRAERTRRLRHRDHVPMDQIETRDRMEIGLCDPFHRHLNVGQLIAIADHYVLTPNSDLEANWLKNQVQSVLQQIGITATLPRPNASRHVQPLHTSQTN
jgi:AAA domain